MSNIANENFTMKINLSIKGEFARLSQHFYKNKPSKKTVVYIFS